MSQTRRQWVYQQLSGDPAGDSRLTPVNWMLVALIVLAVTASILATEPLLQARLGHTLSGIEYICGIGFVAEYCARFWTAAEEPSSTSPAAKRWGFANSFLGLLDLFIIVVTFLPIVAPGLAVFRVVRLLRLLMLAKFGRFSGAFRKLADAIHARRYELYVTLALASGLLLLGATLLFVVEGPIQPDKFGSIPRSLWWAIITLTTVGYGDVSPITPFGKVLAALVALAGIGMVAMPTGILAAAFSDAMQKRRDLDD